MKKLIKQFGGSITPKEKKRLALSKYWKGGKFENLETTTMDINPRTLPGLLKKQFTNTEGREPKINLPITPFQADLFNTKSDKFIWYGHATLLLKLENLNILIDPMFGEDASPIAPMQTKRFSTGSMKIIQLLPEIDYLLLTHDHYDHLDMESILELKSKVKNYIVPLGLSRHLVAWGIASELITEMDWWDTIALKDIQLSYTPSRHFSGRGLTDRAKSLWGGFMFQTPKRKVYLSGDGGYGAHFKEIELRYGAIDFAFVECGQYNQEWHQIHMYPEESVQAMLDVKAKLVMPIHWAGFKLAMHHWKDPILRFIKEAHEKKQEYISPRIGQIVELDENFSSESWWESYD